MALPSFLRLRDVGLTNRDLDRVQDNIERAFRPVASKEILDGRLIQGVVVTTASVAVSHGLGRNLVGWAVVDKNANADVWRVGTANADTLLTLDASATVTVSLWVF